MDCNIVWIDMEMTGLDPEQAVIVEIATVITDGDLNIVAEGPELAINHPACVLENMDPWSREHHEESGLLKRIMDSEIDTPKAEKATLDFLKLHCIEGESPLAGNSVGQDRRFMYKYMPELESFLHHRIVDVSSFKEMARRWYPELAHYEKEHAHTALSDIRESINELKYYRETILVKNPN